MTTGRFKVGNPIFIFEGLFLSSSSYLIGINILFYLHSNQQHLSACVSASVFILLNNFL